MNLTEARKLKVGDPVITCNGKYRQHGRVTAIEPHHSGNGFWISFRWTTRDKAFYGRKRHQSVYLP